VLAATALVVACGQSRKDERLLRLKFEEAASPSPQALVHFDCEADNPEPPTLINVSDDATFNVKVDDIQNGSYVANFDVVLHLLKEWVAIVPRVEVDWNRALGCGSLMTALQTGAPTDAASKAFPLHVSHTNLQGRLFEMEYDIH
jgi:hypothetical protein